MLIALLFLGIATRGALAQSNPAPSETATAAAAEAAATADQDPEIVVEGDVPKEERRVCETRVQTGSFMPKRARRTVAQAEQEERAAEQLFENVRRDREARGQIQLQCEVQSCRQ